jgi:hypothetical protein
MSAVNNLTEKICTEIEEKVSAAIKPIAEEYGLNYELPQSSCYPDGTLLVVRSQFSVPEREKTVASQKEEEDFICYAESFGMQANWLGRSFQRGNFNYKVVGLRVHAPKQCAILERVDGSRCYENGALVAKYLG